MPSPSWNDFKTTNPAYFPIVLGIPSWKLSIPANPWDSLMDGIANLHADINGSNKNITNLGSLWVSGGGGNTPLMDVAGTIRATGVSVPITGAGVQMSYVSGGGLISSYDFGGAAYKPTVIEGLPIKFGQMATGLSIFYVPNALSTSTSFDANLWNGSVSFWVDEANNLLTFRVRYSGGTLKKATVALV